MNPLQTDISLWQFPASAILAAAFVLLLWAADRYYATSRIYRYLASAGTAVGLLGVVITLIAVEGVWGVGLYHTYPFIALTLLLTASLGLVTLRRLRTRRTMGFLLNHGGLFLIFWGSLFGAPDITRAHLIVPYNEAVTLAYTASGAAIPLPFAVQLHRFSINRYDDGSPRQFRSEVTIGEQTAEIAVNSPAKYRGYRFYQDSYDTQNEQYTVLLVIRDPWLGVVWAGIALLAAGAILMLFRK